MGRVLYWLPRILSLLFVAFLSMFALDVFGAYKGWELAIALFMHLIPSLVLLIATAIAWKYDLVGTVAFFGFAVWYVWWAGFDQPWSWYLLIALPVAIIGSMYLSHWFESRKKQTRL